MVFILVVGDLHIPHRVGELPEKFKSLWQAGKVDQILCTGNVTHKEVREYFRSITNNTVLVAGQEDGAGLNESEIVSQGDFKIGLIHGHTIVPSGDRQALFTLASNLGVDILISGHTHEPHLFQKEEKLFLNPGTGSGAYSGFCATHVPSFLLLDLQANKLKIYRYQLVDGNVDVQLTTFVVVLQVRNVYRVQLLGSQRCRQDLRHGQHYPSIETHRDRKSYSHVFRCFLLAIFQGSQKP